jgi:hypothetical protein
LGRPSYTLNRRRQPTSAERLGAVMRGVPLACFRCSEPYDRGSLIGSALEIEDEADAIALELLAPQAEIARTRPVPDALARQFGIPLRMAEVAISLRERVQRGPTVLDIFRARPKGDAEAPSLAGPNSRSPGKFS